MNPAEKFDKTLDAIRLIDLKPQYHCGHCGVAGKVHAYREFPHMGIRLICMVCGAKASVRIRPKHPAHRIAAAACYALKKQYNKAVAEELMK